MEIQQKHEDRNDQSVLLHDVRNVYWFCCFMDFLGGARNPVSSDKREEIGLGRISVKCFTVREEWGTSHVKTVLPVVNMVEMTLTLTAPSFFLERKAREAGNCADTGATRRVSQEGIFFVLVGCVRSHSHMGSTVSLFFRLSSVALTFGFPPPPTSHHMDHKWLEVRRHPRVVLLAACNCRVCARQKMKFWTWYADR